MDPPATDAAVVDWFRYIISGVGAILTLVIGAVWRRQDHADDKVDKVSDRLSRELADHVLEDERTFAKKDDMREVYQILSRELTEIKNTQERALERILDKIDDLRK